MSNMKKPYSAPKLTRCLLLSIDDVRAALEECSACCLDEPEEVEKVVAALVERSSRPR